MKWKNTSFSLRSYLKRLTQTLHCTKIDVSRSIQWNTNLCDVILMYTICTNRLRHFVYIEYCPLTRVIMIDNNWRWSVITYWFYHWSNTYLSPNFGIWPFLRDSVICAKTTSFFRTNQNARYELLEETQGSSTNKMAGKTLSESTIPRLGGASLCFGFSFRSMFLAFLKSGEHQSNQLARPMEFNVVFTVSRPHVWEHATSNCH